jgi:uncharacterized YigZ family protein
METYKTITRGADAEYKDRGSKFLAIAFPMQSPEEFKLKLAEIKKEHPKANHHCFAYRIGTDGNKFRVGDDGEPSGSAGRPILGQLDSQGITDAGIVVVRYFGGTLLGVPGLINAYKMAATLALQVSLIEEKAVMKNLRITCNYTDINDVMRIIKLCNGQLVSNDQGLFCTVKVAVPKNRLEAALEQLGLLYQVETAVETNSK